jgi:hypothetical protein
LHMLIMLCSAVDVLQICCRAGRAVLGMQWFWTPAARTGTRLIEVISAFEIGCMVGARVINGRQRPRFLGPPHCNLGWI